MPDDSDLVAFLRSIAAGDHRGIARGLAVPEFVVAATSVGASRAEAETYFLTEIRHYMYAGDTALHIAAAAYDRETAASLVVRGAHVRARNRRGAEPIHYAADGSPGEVHWNPAAQSAVIAFLVAEGADPNAYDKSGVAALHRAVRTRSSAAVRALIDNGADPRLRNKKGSTPMDLAVQNTGRSGSGSDAAKAQQQVIIGLLRQHGAA